MDINVQSNIDQVIASTLKLHPQYRFAVSLALNKTANKVREHQQNVVLREVFDKPTQWTRNAFYVASANKASLQATVGIRPSQAEYLKYQIFGGNRAPKKMALRLPTEIQLDESGNIPRGAIRKLVERARAGKRLTKGQARKLGVSNRLDLFYGDPTDGRPAGLYKRVNVGTRNESLVPLVVFPKQSAKYKKRYDFYATVEATARREIAPAMQEAWSYALATSK